MSDVYVTFGGDSSELEASLASAKVAVSALTRELADLAREQAEAGAGVDSDIGQQMVDLGGKLSDAKEHAASLKHELGGVGKSEGGEEERVNMLERMTGALSGMLSPIIEIKSHFSEMIELIAAAFAVEKIAEWVSETTEAMESVESEAAKLGVSLEQVQILQGMATLAGTDYSELAQQFERLQLQLSRVSDRATSAGEALRVLGLSASELRGQSIEKQIESIAEAFSKFADGQGKTAAAVALLGRAGADMIPFLDKGREGIEELRQVVERTGIVMSGELVESMAQTREHVSELSLAWRAASQEIFAAFNPAIDALVQALNRFLEKLTVNQIREWTVEGIAAFRGLADGAIDGFEQIRAEMDTVINLFERMWSVVSTVAASVSGAVMTIANAVREVGAALDGLHEKTLNAASRGGEDGRKLGGMLGGRGGGGGQSYGGLDASAFPVRGDLGDQSRQFQFEAALQGQRLKSGIESYTKSLSELFGKASEDVKRGANGEAEKGAKPQVPGMDLGGGGRGKASQEASREVRAAYESEVQAAQEEAAETQKTLDGRLQRKRIETEEWLRLSLAALDKEQHAIQHAADKALASSALTASQKTELANREQRELATIAQKIIEDQNKAAAAVQKQWDAAFASINGAVDGQINGLLRGTTSWATALKNVLASLTEDVLKFFVNWGLKAAERFAQDGIMAAAGLATQKATNAAAAQSDAGKAAAGAYSAVAGIPIIGPVIAPAAAAAAYAGTLAFASADIGMWNVPQDQLAMVHKNELIMPAAESSAFRSLLSGAASGQSQSDGGGAGGDVHLHVHAIDGASVKSFFNSHRDHIVNTVREGMRGGSKGALQMAAGR